MGIDYSDEVGWPAEGGAVTRPSPHRVTQEARDAARDELLSMGVKLRGPERRELWQRAVAYRWRYKRNQAWRREHDSRRIGA